MNPSVSSTLAGTGTRTIEAPELLPNLAGWFDSRSPAYFTFSTGNSISGWVPRMGSLGAVPLSQGTFANQPIYQTAVPELNNRPAVKWDATNDWLTAAIASVWAFMHDGSDMSYFYVLRANNNGATQSVFSTCGQAQTSIGITESSNLASFTSVTCNGGGTAYQNVTFSQGAGQYEQGVSRWRCVVVQGGVKKTYCQSNLSSSTADTAGQTPSLAAPNLPLRVGSFSGPNTINGWLAQLIFYKAALTQAQANSLGSWANVEYLVAA